MRSLLVALCLFASYVVACDEAVRDVLLQHYQQWQDTNNRNYKYILNKQCFCAPEYTQELQVTVFNGKVTDVISTDSGEKVKSKIFDQQLTITEWYELALDSLSNKHGEVKVTFDAGVSYPSSVYIDQHKMRADDEYTVFIKQLIQQ